MKFRVFTEEETGDKIAINVDTVARAVEDKSESGESVTQIVMIDQGDVVWVREDFATVVSRLNTIAE